MRRPKRSFLVLGIMSGTSIDAVDYALCRAGPGHIELVTHWNIPFPRKLERNLHRAAQGNASAHELAQWHHDLGRFYAAATPPFPEGSHPELAGLHGQTVFHNPARRAPATLQLGEPAYLAERLGAPVVSNFRTADMAAGGQGAPLATLFHLKAFAQPRRHVCVHNLGGISNVTSIDSSENPPRIAAFDTGPANVLLDIASRFYSDGRRPFDKEGRWAAEGRVIEKCLRRFLKHPFLALHPPKSTGRELFGESFFLKAEPLLRHHSATPRDALATLTEFSAASIALNYRRFLKRPAAEVILAGGGAANTTLRRRIEHHLRLWAPDCRVLTSEDRGWPHQAIEASAFALLAVYRWLGLPGNLPATTGAGHPCLLGQISGA